MKKFIVLCSALVFGLCSESYAWEVDLDEVTIGGETTIDKEPFTPKLSLVAVQERMSKLKSVSGSTGLGQRVFRRLYNSWLSDNSKWTGQGRNSTIDNIQGYCNQKFLPAFEEVLRSIEKQIEKATPEDEGEGQEEGSSKEAQEKAIDTADEIKEDKKIQRGKLEAVTDALEASLYTGINDGEEVAPDMTNIDAAFATLDLESLAEQFGKAGVDVDEDFVVSLKRVWAMQALNMSDSRRLDRYGKYEVEVEGDDKNTWYRPLDDLYNPNSFVDGAGAGHAATFLLDHFRGTDTLKDFPTDDDKWNLRGIYGIGYPSNDLAPKIDADDKDNRSTGDDGKLLLQHLFNEYDSRKTTSTDSSEQTTDKMKYHLNLAARLLDEISKEQDKVVKKDQEDNPRIQEYKVDSIVFHAFRQYMTQALREAITLIKEKESSGS